MKNFLTLLSLLLFVGLNGYATEYPYKTLTFSAATNSKPTGVYNNTSWSATIEDFTWNIVNFSNGNNTWNYVKCGKNDDAVKATITTSTAIDRAISSVAINIDAITVYKDNIITLETSTTSDFSTPIEVLPFDNSGGLQTVTLSLPAANLFYRLTFDCVSGNANGYIQLSKVIYNVANLTKPEFSFDTDEVALDIADKDEFVAPKISTNSDGTVTYTSDNESVAKVDNDGNVTILQCGIANITANVPFTDKYIAATASYTLRISDPSTAFLLLTLGNSISAGDHIVIASGTTGNVSVANKYVETNENITASPATVTNGELDILSAPNTAILTIDGNVNERTLFDGNYYWYTNKSSSSLLKGKTANDNNTKTSIVIQDGNTASIQFKEVSNYNLIRYHSSNNAFSCYKIGSQNPIYIFRQTPISQPVIIGVTGFATFCPTEYDVRIPENVDVFYIKKDGIGESSVTVTPYDGKKLRKGEGVIIRGSGEYQFARTINADAIPDNELKGTTENTKLLAGEAYILALDPNDEKTAVFSVCNAGTLRAGKAYLPIPAQSTDNAAALRFIFPDDKPTSIQQTEQAPITEHHAYNLAGQRVNKEYHGITIINGKKILNLK